MATKNHLQICEPVCCHWHLGEIRLKNNVMDWKLHVCELVSIELASSNGETFSHFFCHIDFGHNRRNGFSSTNSSCYRLMMLLSSLSILIYKYGGILFLNWLHSPTEIVIAEISWDNNYYWITFKSKTEHIGTFTNRKT